jgi:corrinoid protein of di/trimethylamine methyltransferase
MEHLETLVREVKAGNADEAVAAVRVVIDEGADDREIIQALTTGIREVGEQFERMEIFIPGLMLAARAMQAVMGELEESFQDSASVQARQGVVVIGTVAGDMHEIGKDVVTNLLRVQGFEVHDLGVDVNALDFIRKAEEVNADVIGASALMTTTMPAQYEIIELLREMGLRDKYHVIFGGAPVTQDWVDECGADSWGENAWKSIHTLEAYMDQKRGERPDAAL